MKLEEVEDQIIHCLQRQCSDFPQAELLVRLHESMVRKLEAEVGFVKGHPPAPVVRLWGADNELLKLSNFMRATPQERDEMSFNSFGMILNLGTHHEIFTPDGWKHL